MKYYDDQIYQDASFAERIGSPDEIDAAIGRVVEAFSFLEENLRNVITILLDVEPEIGEIITAEMSFKGLLNLLASLFKYKSARGDFHVEGENISERFGELLKLCFRAEEERNKIIHSSYIARRYRVKTTAKAKMGLKTSIEEIDADRLLDISDFIGSVGMYVQELPLALNMATSISSGPLLIQYLYNDEVFAAFGHEEPSGT